MRGISIIMKNLLILLQPVVPEGEEVEIFPVQSLIMIEYIKVVDVLELVGLGVSDVMHIYPYIKPKFPNHIEGMFNGFYSAMTERT